MRLRDTAVGVYVVFFFVFFFSIKAIQHPVRSHLCGSYDLCERQPGPCMRAIGCTDRFGQIREQRWAGLDRSDSFGSSLLPNPDHSNHTLLIVAILYHTVLTHKVLPAHFTFYSNPVRIIRGIKIPIFAVLWFKYVLKFFFILGFGHGFERRSQQDFWKAFARLVVWGGAHGASTVNNMVPSPVGAESPFQMLCVWVAAWAGWKVTEIRQRRQTPTCLSQATF